MTFHGPQKYSHWSLHVANVDDVLTIPFLFPYSTPIQCLSDHCLDGPQQGNVALSPQTPGQRRTLVTNVQRLPLCLKDLGCCCRLISTPCHRRRPAAVEMERSRHCVYAAEVMNFPDPESYVKSDHEHRQLVRRLTPSATDEAKELQEGLLARLTPL